MIKVYTSSVIDAPADAVWARVRDFNGLPQWTPFVAESRIEEGQPADRITSDIDRVTDRTHDLVSAVTIPIFAEHVQQALTGEADVERALRALRAQAVPRPVHVARTVRRLHGRDHAQGLEARHVRGRHLGGLLRL